MRTFPEPFIAQLFFKKPVRLFQALPSDSLFPLSVQTSMTGPLLAPAGVSPVILVCVFRILIGINADQKKDYFIRSSSMVGIKAC